MGRPWNSLYQYFTSVSFKFLKFIQVYVTETTIFFRDFGLTEEESDLIWHPVIAFERLMVFKHTPWYGLDDSSGNLVFPKSVRNQNRLATEMFQLTFTCNFDFSGFPFDSHECPIEYGDAASSKEQMRFNITQGVFGNMSTKIGVEPIIIDNLPFPFEFRLVVLPTFEITSIYKISYSYTGIVLKMRRKSPGQLLCGYFYPTAAFALLSMLSFLIKPDTVSSLCRICLNYEFGFKVLIHLSYCVINYTLIYPKRFQVEWE